MTFLTQEDSAVFYDLKQTLLASPVSANEKHPSQLRISFLRGKIADLAGECQQYLKQKERGHIPFASDNIYSFKQKTSSLFIGYILFSIALILYMLSSIR